MIVVWCCLGAGAWTLFCVGYGWWLRGATEWQRENNTTVVPPLLERREEPQPEEEKPLSEES